MLLASCAIEKKELAPLFIEATNFGKFEIPENYKTYTMFIATSHHYIEKITTKELYKFKKEFIRLGKSIGTENLAVWVNDPRSETLNVELGKTYCDRLDSWYGLYLDYSDGPFIIFLTHHPDIKPNENDFAATISFEHKTNDYIVEAMEYLEAQIRRGKVSKFKTTTVDFWLDLKSFATKNAKHLKDVIVIVVNAMT